MSEESEQIERALEKFNICGHSGSSFFIEVNKETNTKQFLGYCGYQKRQIDIYPTCKICLRCDRKKKKPSKKTPTQINKIKQGRKRQQEKKKAGEEFRVRRPQRDSFKNSR